MATAVVAYASALRSAGPVPHEGESFDFSAAFVQAVARVPAAEMRRLLAVEDPGKRLDGVFKAVRAAAAAPCPGPHAMGDGAWGRAAAVLSRSSHAAVSLVVGSVSYAVRGLECAREEREDVTEAFNGGFGEFFALALQAKACRQAAAWLTVAARAVGVRSTCGLAPDFGTALRYRPSQAWQSHTVRFALLAAPREQRTDLGRAATLVAEAVRAFQGVGALQPRGFYLLPLNNPVEPHRWGMSEAVAKQHCKQLAEKSNGFVVAHNGSLERASEVRCGLVALFTFGKAAEHEDLVSFAADSLARVLGVGVKQCVRHAVSGLPRAGDVVPDLLEGDPASHLDEAAAQLADEVLVAVALSPERKVQRAEIERWFDNAGPSVVWRLARRLATRGVDLLEVDESLAEARLGAARALSDVFVAAGPQTVANAALAMSDGNADRALGLCVESNAEDAVAELVTRHGADPGRCELKVLLHSPPSTAVWLLHHGLRPGRRTRNFHFSAGHASTLRLYLRVAHREDGELAVCDTVREKLVHDGKLMVPRLSVECDDVLYCVRCACAAAEHLWADGTTGDDDDDDDDDDDAYGNSSAPGVDQRPLLRHRS